MKLTELDKELLELTTLTVPWYMVCGDFQERYGGPDQLALRLFELQHAELVSIESTHPTTMPTPEALAADARAHGCYEDFGSSAESRWVVVATDAGFAAVSDRLGEQ